MPKIDLGTTNPQPEDRGKRWVEVPEKDLFEFPFPTIRVNVQEFGPGKHYVEADLADWIEERIRVNERADKRVLMRNPDLKAQDVMNRFGAGRNGRGNFVSNPDAVMQG